MSDKTAITKVDESKPVRQDAESDASNLERMLADTRSLSEDVAEWLRLKVKLIQLEVHERITNEVNAVLSSIVVLGLLLTSFLMGMIAVGLYLGDLLGNIAYGFAVVSAFVAIVALVLGRIQPRWMGEAMNSLVPRRWFKDGKQEDENISKS